MEKETLRLHISPISKELKENEKDFQERLSEYGKIIKPLEYFKKELSDFWFGYITMEFASAAKFSKLQSDLNGVKFKGVTLRIEKALPRYNELFNNKVVNKNEENKYIETNVDDKKTDTRDLICGKIIPGRIRKPRNENELKNFTFRTIIKGKFKNGREKIITMRPGKTNKKKKLWGIKKVPLDSLVSLFSNGIWKNSLNEIVDKLQERRDIRKLDSNLITNSEKPDLENHLNEDSEKKEYEEEKSRNLAVLDSLFGNDPEEKNLNSSNIDTVDFDSASDSEVDTKTETNVLKTLFDPIKGEVTSNEVFTFFDHNEDDQSDDTQQISNNTNQNKASIQTNIADLVSLPESNKGLFFLHNDSPYLSTMSALSKLKTPVEQLPTREKWEEEFYENRGEWSRLAKRRKRDAIRSEKRSRLRRHQISHPLLENVH